MIAFLVAVAVNFLTGFSDGRYSDKPENTITFSGHGEMNAVPDIANIYLTIRKEAKTVKEAQANVAKVEEKVLTFFKNSEVDEKDIKTTNASFNPKYEFQYNDYTTCGALNCRPQPGKSVLIGYEAYQNINVKIRNTDNVGKIMEGLGTLGVEELSGPNFSVDNEEILKAEARKKAIDDAKGKAKILAKDLGVRLGRITSFSESGDYPMPMYAKTMMADGTSDDSVSAQIPKGENTISSDITITYQIK